MTGAEFTIALLDKLVWPTVVVFAILILRKPVAALVPLAKKLKYKDFELEFGQELKAISKKAEGAFPEMKPDKKAALIATAEHMSNAAVIEAWNVVDDAAELLCKSIDSNIDLNVDTRYKLIEDFLLEQKVIDTKKGKLFNELRQLRNKVAHAAGYEVGKAEAIQYIDLCFKLTEYLTGLTSTSRK